MLPRQLDLSLSLQAGSCDPTDTGGLAPLARVPLPGSASAAASECPDLQGAVVVRSAEAPLDANKVCTHPYKPHASSGVPSAQTFGIRYTQSPGAWCSTTWVMMGADVA